MIQNIFWSVLKLFFALMLLMLAAHFILVNIPGIPAVQYVSTSENKSALIETDEPIHQAIQRRGLHLPDFYFSLHSAALPPVYFETYKPEEKRNIKQMAYHFGNPETVDKFIRQLKRCKTYFGDDSSKNTYHQWLTDYCSSYNTTNNTLHRSVIANQENESLVTLYNLQTSMHQQRIVWKKFFPVLSFHPGNRFHQFLFGNGEDLKGIFHGSLGVSWLTRLPVSEMILSGFRWTFLLSILSMLISLLLSIIIGLKTGANAGSAFDKFLSQSLFILYSVPVFWLAVLLLMLFSNPHAFNWLPSSGIQPLNGFQVGTTFINRVISTIPYLILPLTCMIIPSLAFMARTLRASTSEIMHQDFIRTARAKGLSEKSILHKHVFRNVLLQVITLFALAWPALLSGSVIIESVFSIPGMGLLTYQAVLQQDFPVLAGIFITSGAVTLASFTLSDILYRMADPRLKT